MATRRLTLAAAALLLAAPALAQQPAQQAAPDPAKIAALAGMKGIFTADANDLEGKYLKLLDAMGAKLDYRPGAGVRSAGEVFAHVAAANFMVPTAWGVKPPAGVDAMAVSKLTDRAQIADALRRSFEHVRAAVSAVPDSEMERPVRLFGMDATVRRAQMAVFTHMHEHLGQSIAYARASGVTPPWSAQ
jgi:uncharacterized damage-inducible protein DinB